MTIAWRKRDPEPADRALSGALALGAALAVGGAAYYLALTLLSREPISLRPEDGRELGSGSSDRTLGDGRA